MIDDKSSFHELRIYKIQSGRMPDMVDRFQNGLSWLFPKHGVNVMGGWTTLHGPEQGHFLYLMRWNSLTQRMQAFANFAADPAWHELRNKTNGPSEFLDEFEIHFLKNFYSPELERAITPQSSAAVHDLTFYPVEPGMFAPMRARLQDHHFAQFQAAEARILGAFDAITGPRLPASFTLTEWANLNAWQEAHHGMQAQAAERARHQAEMSKYGRPVLGRVKRYALTPLPVTWAKP